MVKPISPLPCIVQKAFFFFILSISLFYIPHKHSLSYITIHFSIQTHVIGKAIKITCEVMFTRPNCPGDLMFLGFKRSSTLQRGTFKYIFSNYFVWSKSYYHVEWRSIYYEGHKMCMFFRFCCFLWYMFRKNEFSFVKFISFINEANKQYKFSVTRLRKCFLSSAGMWVIIE